MASMISAGHGGFMGWKRRAWRVREGVGISMGNSEYSRAKGWIIYGHVLHAQAVSDKTFPLVLVACDVPFSNPLPYFRLKIRINTYFEFHFEG